MPNEPSAVVNASPLVALAAALDDFRLLGQAVERFVVPGEVFDELLAGAERDSTAGLVRASACLLANPGGG